MYKSKGVAGLRVGHPVRLVRFGGWRLGATAVLAVCLLASCSSSKSPAGSAGTVTEQAHLAPVPSGTLGVVVSSDAVDVANVAIPAFRRFDPSQPVTLDVVPADRLVAAASTPGVTTLISSNQAVLSSLAQSGVTYQPIEFVRSILQLIVTRPDPKDVQSLADLPGGASVGVLPGTTAAGLAAQAVLAGAGLHPVVYASASAMVKAVQSGKIQAGLLDLSDVDAAGSAIRAFDLPDGTGATDYYVALTKKAGGNAVQQLISSLLVGAANQALVSANYLVPSGGSTTDSGQ